MATLIPSLGSCVSRMTSGERRLAERLEAKLDDDYRLWYDVPMGPRNTQSRDMRAQPPSQRKRPMQIRLRSDGFDANSNKIQAMNMKVSKGLEYHVVALTSLGHMPAPGRSEGGGTGVLCGGDSRIAATSHHDKHTTSIWGLSEINGIDIGSAPEDLYATRKRITKSSLRK